jgi:hypothetical protein
LTTCGNDELKGGTGRTRKRLESHAKKREKKRKHFTKFNISRFFRKEAAKCEREK